MRGLCITVLNSRDRANPNSGGAEVFTHEVSKRIARQGHDVTLVTSRFHGSSREETVDNVKVARVGNQATVFLRARAYYKEHLAGRCDLVVDEYTLRPFFAPRFVKEPVIFFAHELAREKYLYAMPPPVGFMFYRYVEPRWIKSYADTPTIAVSESTRKDLAGLGVKDIQVVHGGIDFGPVSYIPQKEAVPTVLYVGLLKRANIVQDAIEAFRVVAEDLPLSQLWVVGRGPDLARLNRAARGLRVSFWGFVSEAQKLHLMRRAHLLILPAIREGWGLVVTEANACRTPAVGYNVPGLVDSIKHNSTGLLTDPNPRALARGVLLLLRNPALLQTLSDNALEWSREFNWDKTADRFLEILRRAANG